MLKIKWKRLLAIIFIVPVSIAILIFVSEYIRLTTPDCWLSNRLDIPYSMSEAHTVINSNNQHQLTYLAGSSKVYFTFLVNGFEAFLSDDNHLLVISGIGFTYGSNPYYTVLTWELNQSEKPLCYLIVGTQGPVSRRAVSMSADNRYVLLQKDYFGMDCSNYGCIAVYDRVQNQELPYTEYFRDLFQINVNQYGRLEHEYRPSCPTDFAQKELYNFFAEQLEDDECITSILFSKNRQFVVVLKAQGDGVYTPLGDIEIWGIVD